jgi:hypothetical protein
LHSRGCAFLLPKKDIAKKKIESLPPPKLRGSSLQTERIHIALQVAHLKAARVRDVSIADFGLGNGSAKDSYRIDPDSYRVGCAFFAPFFAQAKKGDMLARERKKHLAHLI